jgi:hypothetical protein
MLRCLHGLGDAVQFIRYAPLLKETCRTLTAQSHPELVRLLSCVPSVDRAVTWGEAEDEWDVQMEVTELPRIFRTDLDTISAQVPYIFIPRASKEWARGLIEGPPSLKVGLIWRASNWDESRSLSASDIEPLLATPGCSFYVLQKNADRRIDAHDLQIHADDVADTAELMCGLDLIISVDTMTAHLAGALGKRTWVLLPVAADWRWMSNRTDSPWYPTMTLFRQTGSRDWQETVASVAVALRRMAAVTAPIDRPVRCKQVGRRSKDQ